MRKEVNIGIPVYNEATNILNFLKQLKIVTAKTEYKYKIFICNNGSTDNTEKLVKQYMKKTNLVITYINIKSKGKVYAQKEIIEHINNNNPILFMDADIKIKSQTITKAIQELDNNGNLKVISAYPYVEDKTVKKMNFFYQSINLKRKYHQLLISKYCVKEFHPYTKNDFEIHSRIFFHGRFFILRNKEIYQYPNKKEIVGDDSFLTRAILNKYGPGSIKMLYNLPLYCSPINSIDYLLKSEIRIRKDLEAIYKNYPEFKKYIKLSKLKINWKFIIDTKETNILLKAICFAITYLIIEILAKLIKCDPNKLWNYKSKVVI